MSLYIGSLIISYFIIAIIKGLSTPVWKLKQSDQDRSTGSRVFSLLVVLGLLIILRICSFTPDSKSPLALWLNVIIGYELISGIAKILFGWQLSQISLLLAKLPAVAELIYFVLLVMALFHGITGPGESSAIHNDDTALLSSGGQVLDISLYQKNPAQFLDTARSLLTSQMDEMKQIRQEAEVLKEKYQQTGKPNTPEVVSKVNQFEEKLDAVVPSGEKVLQDVTSPSLTASDAEALVRTLKWDEKTLEKGRNTIKALQQQISN